MVGRDGNDGGRSCRRGSVGEGYTRGLGRHGITLGSNAGGRGGGRGEGGGSQRVGHGGGGGEDEGDGRGHPRQRGHDAMPLGPALTLVASSGRRIIRRPAQ